MLFHGFFVTRGETVDVETALKTFARRGINLDLAPITEILARIGNPQRAFPAVIVGGTNGKGSVCAILASILEQCGYTVGLYTSPHLVDVRERIRINGEIIPHEAFAAIGEEVLAAGGERLTYFELLTAIAFRYFCTRRVDVAILEVGMGGRWDATNVATPLVSLITNISLEHQAYLGRTLALITREKAGIVREKGICITGAEQRIVRDELENICRRREAKLYRLGKEIRVRRCKGGHEFDYWGLSHHYRHLFVALRGRHQVKNAALAIAATEEMARTGFGISEEGLRRGLQCVSWEGRMEVVDGVPLTVLDGAHNDAGMKIFCQAIREEFPNRRLIAVFGCLNDKDYRAMLHRLEQTADVLILTTPRTPRARPAAELATAVRGRAAVVDEPLTAYNIARKQAEIHDVVCITGSLYLVGEVKVHLKKTQ